MSKLVCTLFLLVGVLQTLAAPGREGSAITIEEHSSVAQVEVRIGLLWVQQCVASIITNFHVLSLASCFYGAFYYPDNRRIRIGSDQRLTGGQLVYVRYAHVHPNYGQNARDADLAVIELQEQLIIPTPSVSTVTIITPDYEMPNGVPVQVYGWGTTLSTDDDLYYNLKTRGLFTQDRQQCAEKYAALPVEEDEEDGEIEDERRYITDNMICVGPTYNDGLAYDSRDLGAPIIYSNILTGVVAFGHDSGEYPVVATRVSAFTPWIIKKAQILT